MIYTIDNPKLVAYFFNFKDQETFTGVVKDKYNNIAYFLNGQYHRENEPAIIWSDGDEHWYLNGKKHRTDGPAIEHANGDKEWCLNGKKYGCNNDFTNESWIRFIKLQLLK